MKRLILLRHAKSSWKNPDLDDIDRPLNDRGKHDAPMMGRRLEARGERPSLIITSPAKRARRTARLVAKSINYPVEFLQREDELYLADPDTILKVVARQENSFNKLVVCGHNPGITDLANRMTGSYIDNVPTCGIVAINLPTDRWDAIHDLEAELDYFDFPKRIPVASA